MSLYVCTCITHTQKDYVRTNYQLVGCNDNSFQIYGLKNVACRYSACGDWHESEHAYSLKQVCHMLLHRLRGKEQEKR